MRVLVIGCGSMGLLYAVRLSSGGCSVVLKCRRGEQAALINREGVRIQHPDGGLEEARVPAVVEAPGGQFDAVIIATKAYDFEDALPAALNAAKRTGLLVSIQNGLGCLEALEERAGAWRAAAAVTYYAATRVSGNTVLYMGGTRVVLGQRSRKKHPSLAPLADALRRGGWRAEIVEDIDAWRWDKLIVNAAVNPVTAILGVPNGKLLSSTHALQLCRCIIGEAVEVAERIGVKLPRDPYTAFIETVKATRGNRSSMLQDLEAGRKTEIDYINGALLALASRVKLALPCNSITYTIVKALEEVLTP